MAIRIPHFRPALLLALGLGLSTVRAQDVAPGILSTVSAPTYSNSASVSNSVTDSVSNSFSESAAPKLGLSGSMGLEVLGGLGGAVLGGTLGLGVGGAIGKASCREQEREDPDADLGFCGLGETLMGMAVGGTLGHALGIATAGRLLGADGRFVSALAGSLLSATLLGTYAYYLEDHDLLGGHADRFAIPIMVTMPIGGVMGYNRNYLARPSASSPKDGRVQPATAVPLWNRFSLGWGPYGKRLDVGMGEGTAFRVQARGSVFDELIWGRNAPFAIADLSSAEFALGRGRWEGYGTNGNLYRLQTGLGFRMSLAPSVQAAAAAGIRFDEGSDYVGRMGWFLEGGVRHGRVSGEAGIASPLTLRGSLGWHFTEQVMVNLGMEGYSHSRTNPNRAWPKPPAGYRTGLEVGWTY